MKKFVLTLIAFVAALVISATVLFTRLSGNFNEMEDIDEADYSYFMYDGKRYGLNDISEDVVSGWTEASLFSIGFNYTFKDGDAFECIMDENGVTYYYTLFGIRLDVSEFVVEKTEFTSETVYEVLL